MSEKKRFRAVREWGNLWSLFDHVMGQAIINKSSNRAAVEDGAEKLNREGQGIGDADELRAILAGKGDEHEQSTVENG